MTTSIFSYFVNKYFGGIVGKVTELFNGKKAEDAFMYESMLDEEYSADLSWGASEFNNSIVAADVVSMDSSLPLKKRGTIRTASGEIAKIGIKKTLKEKDLSDISVMRAKGQNEAQIAGKILNNVPVVIKGIKIRLDIMFQQALSTGMVLIDNENNDGTGVRGNFGYKDEHTFHATVADWADTSNATPITDIQQMFDKANDDGDTIEDLYFSKKYFDYARKTEEVKQLVAQDLGQTIVSGTVLKVPTVQQAINAIESEFDVTVHIVNNSYKVEFPDGSQKSIKPWEQGNVIGTPGTTVGRLVHGTLAEDQNRVAGVAYQKSGFILVSEYSVNEPSLAEFTAAQALAMPVIDNGGSMYMLHANATAPISVDVDELEFTAAADTTGKKVNVHCDGSFTVSQTASTTWMTVTKKGNVLTVKVAANDDASAAERTSTITLTDEDGNTATVAVTQAA